MGDNGQTAQPFSERDRHARDRERSRRVGERGTNCYVAADNRRTAMSPITIYTKGWCPYCSSAKDLLQKKGAAFDEIEIDRQPEKRGEMIQRSGGRSTVPQIFIGERHVGGCDDLYALDRRGELDTLLAA
jgi:glutaredoxin 3